MQRLLLLLLLLLNRARQNVSRAPCEGSFAGVVAATAACTDSGGFVWLKGKGKEGRGGHKVYFIFSQHPVIYIKFQLDAYTAKKGRVLSVGFFIVVAQRSCARFAVSVAVDVAVVVAVTVAAAM